MRLKRGLLSGCLVLSLWPAGSGKTQEARLLRQPAIHAERIVFVYANDLWTVPRSGGDARRLTTHVGTETNPAISPDGKTVAFSAQYDGNTDVYLVPIEGGEPKRLTYHPGSDLVRSWTPDGNRVLFASARDTAPIAYNRIWTISVEGGMPQPLPLPMAHQGVYSPSGERLAYVRGPESFSAWRHYRGGLTSRVWLFDFESHDIVKIPRENSNDIDPMWIDETVYFLSDRNHTMNLFSYDTNTQAVRQVTFHDDYDIKRASAGGNAIVYEQAGYLHVFEPGKQRSSRLRIEIRGDLPGRRPHFVNAKPVQAAISATGARAVFEARGDIFTLPAKKGDMRNLTQSSGAHDRHPAWSPDGKWIAWFTDEGGEYELRIIDQKGTEAARRLTLQDPSFYYAPVWSPDSKKIAYADKRLNLWWLDVASGKATEIDKDTYDHPQRSLDHVWSPDSKWIGYSKRLEDHLHAIFVYSLQDDKSYQVTDGLADAISPAFDRSGKYLYFLASTDYALNTGWLDLSSLERPFAHGLYLIVLSAEESSPLLPESDEESSEEDNNSENGTDGKKKESQGQQKKQAQNGSQPSKGDEPDEKKPAVEVRIDLEHLEQRILAVDVPVKNYGSLKSGQENILFYTERIHGEEGLKLHRYDLKEKKSEEVMTGISRYDVSADGKKLLYVSADGNTYGIVDATGKAKVGDGKLKTTELRMRVDPIAEWKQIYNEAWRINRDFLYDSELHGADWEAIRQKYQPLVKHVAHRSDLSYIVQNVIGELTIGHSRAGGGELPEPDRVPVGLLGADIGIQGEYYQIQRIFTGESWNPKLRAPLVGPGLKVSVQDYVLEVNGHPLRRGENFYRWFEGTAGKQTVLRINDRPTVKDSRLVTVVPVPGEQGLRSRAWVEDNRRKVDELSQGKLAYVYLPNTSNAGYVAFNRYYFAQQNRQGAIIDERFNGGGFAADYFADLMSRPLMNYFATRDGKEFSTPMAQIFGPKVMIINEYAGSGGDALPYYFRFRKIGPLVGTRTWGGLVGHHGGVGLIDGGFVSSPNLAFYNLEGEWDVENEGVPPDIEVEMTPKRVIEGHDPQLERAVEEAMRLLEESRFKHTPRPPPIDRVSPRD